MEQSKSNWTIAGIFALYLSYVILPIFSLYMGSAIRTALAILCLLVLISGYNFLGNLKELVLLTLIPIFDSFLRLISEGQTLADAIYVYANVVIPVLIALYVFNQQDSLLTKRLFILVSIMWMITLVTSIIGNYIMPGATRALASSASEAAGFFDATRMLNIGGFDFAYSLPILLPMLIYCVRFTKYRMVSFVVLAAFCFMILKAEYTIAILAAMCILLLLFIKKVSNPKGFIIILSISLFFFIVLRKPLADLMYEVGQIISSEDVSARLIDLSYFMQGIEVDAQSDVAARSDKYSEGLAGFLSSPIWGTGKHLGGHSYILGNLACYGLLGLGMLLVMTKAVYTHFISPFKNEDFYSYLVCSYLVAIFFMTFNPQPFILTIMFLLPLFGRFMSNVNNDTAI